MNGSHKKKLIRLLEQYLKEEYEWRLAKDDADVISINTALRINQKLGKYAVIVGKNVDFACLFDGLGIQKTRRNAFL